MNVREKIWFRGTVQKSAVPCGFCEMDLLTDWGIFTGENEVKEGRIERENFFGVKIVNAGTCDEDVAVKIVITGSCD